MLLCVSLYPSVMALIAISRRFLSLCVIIDQNHIARDGLFVFRLRFSVLLPIHLGYMLAIIYGFCIRNRNASTYY